MPEKLSVETNHAAMFVEFHANGTCVAASALLMHGFGFRNEENFPAGETEAYTPIEVLAMHEIPFIERTHLLDCGAPNEHKRPRSSFDLDWLTRYRLAIHQKPSETRMHLLQPIELQDSN